MNVGTLTIKGEEGRLQRFQLISADQFTTFTVISRQPTTSVQGPYICVYIYLFSYHVKTHIDSPNYYAIYMQDEHFPLVTLLILLSSL